MASVEVKYYDFQLKLKTLELPLVTVVLIPLGIGLFGAWCLWLSNWIKMQLVIRKQKKTILLMEEELKMFKNTPQLPAQVESSNDSWNSFIISKIKFRQDVAGLGNEPRLIPI